MNLVFDQGNSFIKCATFEQGTLLQVESIPNANAQELQQWVVKRAPNCRKAIFSGVGKEQGMALIKKVLPKVLEVSAKTKVPFTTQYKTPNTWGADRKALVMAAYIQHPAKDVLVIDAGSCVTFDFLNTTGVHVGGSIHPGLYMRAKAMQHFTARLPLVKVPNTALLSGNTTENNLQSGVLNGFKFEIKATIDAYLARYPHMIVLITGGDAKYLAEYVKNGIFAAPNLLLKGLNNILEYNAE